MSKRNSKLALRAWLVLAPCVGLTMPCSVFGQEAGKNKTWSYHFGAGLLSTTVKSTPARGQGIGTHSFGLLLSASPRLYRVFAPRVDLGIEFYDDKQQFSQLTTGGEKSSSVNMFFASLAIGGLIPPFHLDDKPQGARLSLGAYVGADWIGGERSITDCVNCLEEELDLKGGLYVEPSLQMDFSVHSGVGLFYRFYNNDSDLESRLLLKYIHSL